MLHSGLVVLLLAGLVEAGIYYAYTEFPAAELDQQKPIIFSPTEKLNVSEFGKEGGC